MQQKGAQKGFANQGFHCEIAEIRDPAWMMQFCGLPVSWETNNFLRLETKKPSPFAR
jgi:hypothetical protein